MALNRRSTMIGLVYNRFTVFLLITILYSLLVESQGGIRGGWRFAGQYLEDTDSPVSLLVP